MRTDVNGRHAVDPISTEAADGTVAADGVAVRADGESGPTGSPKEEPLRARRQLTGRQWARLASLAVVLVALGAAAGYLVTAAMPVQYAAHAQVVYALTREQPTGFLREDRNMSTQLVLLESRAVLDPVAAEWQTSVDELAAGLSAEVLAESEIIDVRFLDSDPERARDVLSWVVQEYLVVANTDARSDVLNYLNEELFTVLDRMEAVRSGPASDQDQLPPLVEREQWLRTQLDELRMTDLVGPGATELVQPYVDTRPASPRPVETTAGGAAAGLVLAVLAVAFVARRMTRPDAQ